MQKESLDKFFGRKVLSDATTESFNFQHEFSQYSCQFSTVENYLGDARVTLLLEQAGAAQLPVVDGLRKAKHGHIIWNHF